MKEIIGGHFVIDDPTVKVRELNLLTKLAMVEDWSLGYHIAPRRCRLSRKWIFPWTKCYSGTAWIWEPKPLMLDGRANSDDIQPHLETFYVTREEFLVAKLKGKF